MGLKKFWWLIMIKSKNILNLNHFDNGQPYDSIVLNGVQYDFAGALQKYNVIVPQTINSYYCLPYGEKGLLETTRCNGAFAAKLTLQQIIDHGLEDYERIEV